MTFIIYSISTDYTVREKILPDKRSNFNILRERIYLMFIRNIKSIISLIGTGKTRRFSGGEKTEWWFKDL